MGPVDWLLAQIDDDEAEATAAGGRAWRAGVYNVAAEWDDEVAPWLDCDAVSEAAAPHEIVVYDEGRPGTAQVAHIARWDPARVLAECAAKRSIVDLAFRREAVVDGEWGCCHSADHIRQGLCPEHPIDEIPELQLLAQPYAGRPGFPPELALTE